MTAHYLAFDSYPVQDGDWVLVHAAAGGVGPLLTQLAKLRGGRVIATTSTDEKAKLAREAGADETIGYDGFAERVKEITGGEGAAAIYDAVGKTTFLDGLNAIRPTGRMILYGAASGQPDPSTLAQLAPAGLAVRSAPDAQHLHAHAGAAARAGRQGVRPDRRGQARRADRRALPAGRCGRRPILTSRPATPPPSCC